LRPYRGRKAGVMRRFERVSCIQPRIGELHGSVAAAPVNTH